MIEILPEKVHQVESKQPKGAKILADFRWELQGEECSKTFYKIVERQDIQNQTTSELYTQLYWW